MKTPDEKVYHKGPLIFVIRTLLSCKVLNVMLGWESN